MKDAIIFGLAIAGVVFVYIAGIAFIFGASFLLFGLVTPEGFGEAYKFSLAISVPTSILSGVVAFFREWLS